MHLLYPVSYQALPGYMFMFLMSRISYSINIRLRPQAAIGLQFALFKRNYFSF